MSAYAVIFPLHFLNLKPMYGWLMRGYSDQRQSVEENMTSLEITLESKNKMLFPVYGLASKHEKRVREVGGENI